MDAGRLGAGLGAGWTAPPQPGDRPSVPVTGRDTESQWLACDRAGTDPHGSGSESSGPAAPQALQLAERAGARWGRGFAE